MIHVTPISLLLLCTAAINLCIGVYVYRRSPFASQNCAFGFLVVACSLWTTAVAFGYYGTWGNLWAFRLSFASGSLIPLAALVLAERLPIVAVGHVRVRKWLFTPIGLALSALSFAPWMVAATTDSYGMRPVHGPLHPVFVGYFILCFASAIQLLTVRAKATLAPSGRDRLVRGPPSP
jgi:hypothetical protein